MSKRRCALDGRTYCLPLILNSIISSNKRPKIQADCLSQKRRV